MPGAFYILSGTPGSGKTTLARNIMEHVACNLDETVCLISLEQTAEQIWGAIVACHARVSMFQLNQGHLRPEHHSSLVASAGIVHKWPIHVIDTPATLSRIWSTARRMFTRNKCRLVVIDYIQRIRPEQKYHSDESKFTHFSLTLAELAKELKITVMAISSLSREGKLRGSGQLDFDAWAHIKLRRGDDWSPKNLVYSCSFEKQRFGPIIEEENLLLIGDEQRFQWPVGVDALMGEEELP